MIGLILAGILVFSSCALLFGVLWVNSFSPDRTMEQILFHMLAPMEGAEPQSVLSGFLWIGLPTILLTATFFIAAFIRRQRRLQNNQSAWVTIRRMRRIGLIASLLLISASVFLANHYFQLFQFVSDQTNESSFIEDHYVSPEGHLTFPEMKRNLIYIYLESIENTFTSFAEGGAYPDNYLPELVELAKNNISFSNTEKLGGAIPVSGATWTTGAMFAQSTGLPLKLSLACERGDDQDSFYTGVTALGDLLAGQGYQNILMIGSDATFGCRQQFYNQHGQYEILDYEQAREAGKIPEDYYVWWGYEDQKLFTFAREKLLTISQSDQPFNLTLLTVDTHHEDGYFCDLCDNTYPEQYANVLACSSRQIAEFVAWLQEQDFYEQTTIVLAGDHLTMDSDFATDIDPEYVRTTYNVWINPAVSTADIRTTFRQFTAFDIFPTTLAAMGVIIDGDRLGLGTNLFSRHQTLLEMYGTQFLHEMSKRSSFYQKEMIQK